MWNRFYLVVGNRSKLIFLIFFSGLPYVVSQEQALKYQEVQKRLSLAITALKETTQAFCDHITSNWNMIPYAMLYMAKTMRAALHKRFPHVPEKEILKVLDLFS